MHKDATLYHHTNRPIPLLNLDGQTRIPPVETDFVVATNKTLSEGA